MSRYSSRGLSPWPFVGVGLAAGLVGLAVTFQWLALSATPADAAMPAPLATVFITPVTPSPIRLPVQPDVFQSPVRRSGPRLPVAPTATRTPHIVVPPAPRTVPITPVATPGPVFGFPRSAPPAPPAPDTSPITPSAPRVQPPRPAPSTGMATIGRALLLEAERRQVLRFDRSATLSSRILADGLAPTSAEFSVAVGEEVYAAQRADSLTAVVVRVYYRPLSDDDAVLFAQRPSPRGRVEDTLITAEEWQLENSLLMAASRQQVLQLSLSSPLQQRMVADQFVPTALPFTHRLGGVVYVGQRAEHRDSGRVRVYYARNADLSKVFYYAGR